MEKHAIDLLCKEYKISRYQLAKISNISESRISNFVSRKTKIKNLKLETIVNIANALNVSIDLLVRKLIDYEDQLTIRGNKK